MVALAGLEEKNITVKHHTFCPGFYKLTDYSRKFNDWKRTGHGRVDTIEAIAQSCDVFFYDLAYKMGIDEIIIAFHTFSLEKKQVLIFQES